MKYLLLAIIVPMYLTACQNKPAGDKATTSAAKGTPVQAATKMDTEDFEIKTGQLNWTASKTGGQHLGTVEISGGKISTKGNVILAGTFTVDLTSIKSIDLQGEQRTKLEKHLRSEDFFDVSNYPSATFVMTSSHSTSDIPMATHQISGDLTIKGTAKNITIPVNIAFVGEKLLAATPAFTIDRTDWNLKYRSEILGTAPDLLIHDEISLVVTFDAVKT